MCALPVVVCLMAALFVLETIIAATTTSEISETVPVEV